MSSWLPSWSSSSSGSGSGSASGSGGKNKPPAPVYKGVYSQGLDALRLPAIEDERLGKLRVKCMAKFNNLYEGYMKIYKGRKGALQEAALAQLAGDLFNAYIRFLRVSALKGQAMAIAISDEVREPNAESQYEGYAFDTVRKTIYAFPMDDPSGTMQESINAIVGANEAIAKRFGLEHSGAGRGAGPKVDNEVVSAIIASSPDGDEFVLRRLSASGDVYESVDDAVSAPGGAAAGLAVIANEGKENNNNNGAAGAAAGQGSGAAGAGQGSGAASMNGRGGARRKTRKARKSRKAGRKGGRKAKKSTRRH